MPGNGVGCAIEAREKAPLGIARDGVIIGSPPYIDDNGRPARERANASWNSAADWNRCSGAFSSARVTTSSTQAGRSCRNEIAGVGGSFTCDWTIENAVSPLNGSFDVVRR